MAPHTIDAYLVRHGETELNAADRVQGWADSPLTVSGLMQVHDARRALATIDIDAFYVSTAGRARATAEILMRGRVDTPVHFDARLREFGFGSFEAGPNAALAPFGDFDAAIEAISGGGHTGFTGGETGREFVTRLDEVFAEILGSRRHPAIAVVGHGVAFTCYLRRHTTFDGHSLPNGSITHLRVGECGVEFKGTQAAET